MNRKLVFALSLFILLCSSLYVRFNSLQAKSSNGYAVAPLFTLTDIEGNIVALENLTGKIVVLDFFYPQCQYSDDQIVHLEEIYEKYTKDELEIISISPKEIPIQDLEEFKTGPNRFSDLEYEISWIIARDIETQNVTAKYDISGYPTTVIIDQDGYIRYRHEGLTEADVLISEIESLNTRYKIVAAYGSTPTIDGSISVDEWDDAASVSFNYTDVFVKQDGVNLYIAFNVSDATFEWDEVVAVLFDVGHDEGFSYQPDDIVLAVWRDGTFVESYPANETSTMNVIGWTASVHLASEVWQAEFNITYPKINVTAGVEKTLGFVFCSVDINATSKIFYTYPPNLMLYGPPDNPSKWGDMTSTGYNWITEFPSFLILPLFMIATLLAVIAYKRKHSK